jgi:DNA-binding IclR family transcriptional regulator
MTPDKKSQAPALDGGLDIMEALAENSPGLALNEILNIMNVSKSTALRLIKVLIERKYILKDRLTGKYIPGPRMSLLGFGSPIVKIIQEKSTPILQSIANETGDKNTLLIIHFTGMQMQTINKIQPENSINMMDIGTVRGDFSHAPWGWIFYHFMDNIQKAQANKKITQKDLFAERFPAWIKYYKKNGFCFDKHEVHSHIRRLGAPFFGANGKILGAIGMGGTPITMPDKEVKKFGALLLKGANELSQNLI